MEEVGLRRLGGHVSDDLLPSPVLQEKAGRDQQKMVQHGDANGIRALRNYGRIRLSTSTLGHACGVTTE